MIATTDGRGPSRDASRSRVFQALFADRTVSRPELAQQTGLSRATITMIVDDLQREGLVDEVGAGSSSGGRPPMLLRLRESAAYAIGASLYDYEWLIVATDLAARVVDRERVTISADNADAALANLAQGIGRLRSRLDPGKLLPAVGLGPPGLVDMHSGVITSAIDLGWRNVPISRRIQQETGLPAIAANRSKVSALAVFWHMRETPNLIYVSLGTGVATGIINEGRLLVGTNSSAGELGHVTVIPDGPLCECGNRGCLQQLVSERAIANAARQALREAPTGVLMERARNHPELLTAFDVLRAAEDGDAVAVSVVEQAAEHLAVAVANLVNLLNPQIVVLGGPLADASPLLVARVEAGTRRRAMAYPLSVVRVHRNTLGPETGAIGASVLVLQRAHQLVFQRNSVKA